MNRKKIMLGSAAFLTAVLAAFATTNVDDDSSLVQLYEKNSNGQCIDSPCTTIPDAVLCTETVFYDTDLCQNVVTVSAWRSN